MVKQAGSLSSSVTPSRNNAHTRAHSFALLHTAICKVCKSDYHHMRQIQGSSFSV